MPSIQSNWVRTCAIFAFSFLLISSLNRLAADPVLLGDISYQPDTPVIGLTSIFLDNFSDVADLGCSATFPACGGVDISGVLTVIYEDAQGNVQDASISVSSTGPGSTPIYEFNPAQITFESAVLTGVITPVSFPVDGGGTFTSTGTFISDTLTAANGFADISVQQAAAQQGTVVPEPAGEGLLLVSLLALGALVVRRRARQA